MPPPDPAGEITRLLQAHHEGDREAFDLLVPMVYERLRQIARGQLARGGRGELLDTTALVHEAWVQLVDETGVDWQDRSHFYAISARAMRRIVVDFARRRTAMKRGGGAAALTLEPDQLGADRQADLILAVVRAVGSRASLNERLARVVECRYFAEMTEEETAQALGVSLRTVQRDWMRARAWLRKELA
jgi:RNA polymerase sigma factor (TIGR02999 family)